MINSFDIHLHIAIYIISEYFMQISLSIARSFNYFSRYYIINFFLLFYIFIKALSNNKQNFFIKIESNLLSTSGCYSISIISIINSNSSGICFGKQYSSWVLAPQLSSPPTPICILLIVSTV